jgi:hypothetical protein
MIGQVEGVFDSLKGLCDSCNPKLQEPAALALASLSHGNTYNRQMIGKVAGVFDSLKRLCDSDNVHVQESAAVALANLAHNDNNQRMIGQVGGVFDSLKRLCDSASSIVRKHAAKALASLADGNVDNQRMIAQVEGIFDSVVSLLCSDGRPVMQYTTRLLNKLVDHIEFISIPAGTLVIDNRQFSILNDFRNLKTIKIPDSVRFIEPAIGFKDFACLKIDVTPATYHRLSDFLPQRIFDIRTMTGDHFEYTSSNLGFFDEESFVTDLPQDLQETMRTKNIIREFDEFIKIKFLPDNLGFTIGYSPRPTPSEGDKKEVLLYIYQEVSILSRRIGSLREKTLDLLLHDLTERSLKNIGGASDKTLKLYKFINEKTINIVWFLESVRAHPDYLEVMLAKANDIDTRLEARGAASGGGAAAPLFQPSTQTRSSSADDDDEVASNPNYSCSIM